MGIRNEFGGSAMFFVVLELSWGKIIKVVSYISILEYYCISSSVKSRVTVSWVVVRYFY